MDLHIHAIHEAEIVGRLGITFMPKETVESLFPTAQMYAELFKLDPAGYEGWCLYYKGIPRVSYVRVDPSFQRKGLGTNLYLEGARWMAEFGMCLAASKQRNENSVALWAYLNGHPDIPTLILPCGSQAIRLPAPPHAKPFGHH